MTSQHVLLLIFLSIGVAIIMFGFFFMFGSAVTTAIHADKGVRGTERALAAGAAILGLGVFVVGGAVTLIMRGL